MAPTCPKKGQISDLLRQHCGTHFSSSPVITDGIACSSTLRNICSVHGARNKHETLVWCPENMPQTPLAAHERICARQPSPAGHEGAWDLETWPHRTCGKLSRGVIGFVPEGSCPTYLTTFAEELVTAAGLQNRDVGSCPHTYVSSASSMRLRECRTLRRYMCFTCHMCLFGEALQPVKLDRQVRASGTLESVATFNERLPAQLTP